MEKTPATTSSWVTVPPRGEQTARRLVDEDEQPIIESRLHHHHGGGEQPLIAFVQRRAMAARTQQEQTGRPPLDVYGSPATISAVLMSASRHLKSEATQLARLTAGYQWQEGQRRNKGRTSAAAAGLTLPTAVRQQPPKSRVLVGGAVLGQQKTSTGDADPDTISISSFFADDSFPDEVLRESPVHMDVRRLPMFRALAAKYDKFHAAEQHRRNLEHDIEKLPRPRLPLVTRQMRTEAMLPPRPGVDRECVNAEKCICRIDPGRTGYGYTGRAFYLPGEEADDGVDRPCVLCLDANVKIKTLLAQQERMTPTAPFNTYTVPRDPDTGYPPDKRLPVEMERGRLTGVVGAYPDYSDKGYEFRKVPTELALRQGFDVSRGPIYAKMEVGLDDSGNFH